MISEFPPSNLLTELKTLMSSTDQAKRLRADYNKLDLKLPYLQILVGQ
jgi:hypothetical protein